VAAAAEDPDFSYHPSLVHARLGMAIGKRGIQAMNGSVDKKNKTLEYLKGVSRVESKIYQLNDNLKFQQEFNRLHHEAWPEFMLNDEKAVLYWIY